MRRIAPSVVTITVEEERINAADRAAARAERRAEAQADPNAINAIIRRLLSAQADDPGSGADATGALGSGFVVREDGFIVTNRHVIAGARKVRVRMADGRELPATIVGSDAVTDLALLKIEAGHLPALRLGSSQNVSVGDAVIAIGDPYGLGQSVSAGIVSARGRVLEDDPYIDFLQTDAAINRGNSGGPLVTADGTVVGVTSAIFSPSGGSVGLGFAIPAETVAAVVGQIEVHGHVERGYIGISAQTVTPELASALGMKSPTGALVSSVDAHGPAAGTLAIGDVLLKVGSTPVNLRDLSKITARLVPGAVVNMAILRSGEQQSIAMKIGRLPEPASNPAMAGGSDTWVPALRFAVADTTGEIRRSLKAGDEPSGLIVTQLRPAGPGALAGLKVGDLITHLGTKQLFHAADLLAAPKPTPKEPVLLRIVRDGSAVFVAVTGEGSS
ncbi:MAG TPA: trypsin-like peptidase domain-containing protein [Steroidobacteraceae bacterium]|nr:trypsin-like peptidase domain-containing protein [Steroidobacteraceae bacterium]